MSKFSISDTHQEKKNSGCRNIPLTCGYITTKII